MTQWLFSTNAKNIRFLPLIFILFLGVSTSGFFMLIQDPIYEIYLCFLPGFLLQKQITPETPLYPLEDISNELNPYFVTGFTDAVHS